MRWQAVTPVPGDMIRIKCGDVFHHGVFVSEDEVVEFGAPPTMRDNIPQGDVRIRSVTLSAFLRELPFEVAVFSPAERALMPARDEAIKAAKARIGEGGYNIIHNNCQHFATECVVGRRHSEQGDAVREKIRSLPILHVYLARIPDDAPMTSVSHMERQCELDGITNERVKKEKYFAWRLLEYALYRSFGKKIDNLELHRAESGRWICPDLYLSISHTDGAVAVALSRTPVGVDIECDGEKRAERYADKILSEREYAKYLAKGEDERSSYFTEIWCKKESIFKMKDAPDVTAASIDTHASAALTRHFLIGEKKIILAVASDVTDKAKFYDGIDLSSI